MLCIEGISLMLNIFNGKTPTPIYRLAPPLNGKLQTMTVGEEVKDLLLDIIYFGTNMLPRLPKYVHMFLGQSSGMSSLRRLDMSPSSPYKTSYTRTLLVTGRWLQLEPMILILFTVLSRMRHYRQRKSTLYP